MEFETARLRLRPLCLEDTPTVAACPTRPEFTRSFPLRPATEESTAAFVRQVVEVREGVMRRHRFHQGEGCDPAVNAALAGSA